MHQRCDPPLRCRSRYRRVWVAVALLQLACTINPATGRMQFGLAEEDAEVALGRRVATEVASGEGIYDEVPAATSRVAAVGARLAAASERPGLPWSYRILDDASPNAFALPGGFVYVTRGLLAYLNRDDELAAVLAHETAHVTARHGLVQLRKQETARRSVGLLRIFDPNLRHIGGLAARSAELALLRYSRDDEYEADALAVRYIAAAGWDARALLRVLDVLVSLRPESEDGTPTWRSTHPDPAARHSRIAALVGPGMAGNVQPDSGYLAAIDGLAFGDDPRDGYLKDGRFVHPRAGYVIAVPSGWQQVSIHRRLLATSSDQRSLVLVSPTDGGEPSTALDEFLSGGGVTPGQRWKGTIGGLPAASSSFALAQAEGTIDGLVAFAQLDGEITMAMLALGPDDTWSQHVESIAATFSTLAPADARDIEAAVPLRVEIVTLDDPQSLRALQPSGPVSPELLGALNRVDPDVVLEAGRAVKVIRGGAAQAF